MLSISERAKSLKGSPIRRLTPLANAAKKRGECSALDVRDVHFDQPNVIGSSFKLLKKLGFVSSGRIAKSEKKRRHGGLILIWELRERYKAEQFISKCRNRLLELGPEKEQDQLSLAM